MDPNLFGHDAKRQDLCPLIHIHRLPVYMPLIRLRSLYGFDAS